MTKALYQSSRCKCGWFVECLKLRLMTYLLLGNNDHCIVSPNQSSSSFSNPTKCKNQEEGGWTIHWSCHFIYWQLVNTKSRPITTSERIFSFKFRWTNRGNVCLFLPPVNQHKNVENVLCYSINHILKQCVRNITISIHLSEITKLMWEGRQKATDEHVTFAFGWVLLLLRRTKSSWYCS